MTSLTERYLAAALRRIGERERPDVERELRSSIEDAVDDRVAGGEPADTAEIAVLESLGDPARLASGITGRPLYLIGPNLFAQYQRLLVTLLTILVPVVGVGLAALELSRDGGVGDALAAGILGALGVGVQTAFWITLTFAVLERVDIAKLDDADLTAALGPWTVKQLPELPATGRAGIGETVGEILTLMLTLGGLILLRGASLPHGGSGDTVSLLAPQLTDSWLPPALAVVLVSLIGLHIVIFLVGRWTFALAAAHAVMQALFSVPVIVLALGGSIINPAFAAEIGWPPLADGNGVVMLSIAAGVLLVTAWEIIDGFRRARRAAATTSATVEAPAGVRNG